jgi:replication factor C subunit 3/5
LCAGVSALKAEKGLALQDIIQGIYEFASEVTFSGHDRSKGGSSPKKPPPPMMNREAGLLDLGELIEDLSTGGSEKLQLTALLGATKKYVESPPFSHTTFRGT